MERYLTAALLGIFLVGSVPVAAQPPGGQLPPGLQKKVERGEPLPPGWQKKVNYREGDYLDRDLLRYGTIEDIDGNRQRVRIEDRVYTIIRDTREILDILDQ
jgi:hypothetical protein